MLLTIILILFLLSSILIYTMQENETGLCENEGLVEKIDSLLPQLQCGACDYAGCIPYARAIARGTADINQCSPGGYATVREIAGLLGRQPKPLNPKHHSVLPDQTAYIDENICIGCVKCIKSCPVDAIIGARKQMHVVISSRCTGCGLCLPPCPVDCISLRSASVGGGQWVWVKPGKAITVK